MYIFCSTVQLDGLKYFPGCGVYRSKNIYVIYQNIFHSKITNITMKFTLPFSVSEKKF